MNLRLLEKSNRVLEKSWKFVSEKGLNPANFFFQGMGHGKLLKTEASNGAKSIITDIIDGENYKKLCEAGQFLNNPANISFIFNTDGAPLYSSSSVSLWPVFLAVNELPSPDRYTASKI